MNIRTISFLILLGGIYSCSVKSPSEYGKAYCECMKEHNGNMKKCKDILDDAKYDHNGEDEAVQKEFIDAYNACMKEN